MDKQQADKIIVDRLERIYGFSVKHTFSYEEAEELCADIVVQVYTSLLKCGQINNIDAYILRICKHTYSRFVITKKMHRGISIDGVPISYEEEFFDDSSEQELVRLRREIAFLTEKRRRAVYLFYYKNKTVAEIARSMNMPEGTVKWHLNKARSEIKEGIYMERKIGKLGLSPIKATGFGHAGNPGKNRGPEVYLSDRLNLNIVYSVYFTPKTQNEIAEELGITPVFIEDRVAYLEENGFLVKGQGGKYTTYVKFDAATYSNEFEEIKLKKQMEIAEMLTEKYVPAVREALGSVENVYIPTGNRELLESAAVYYAVSSKCGLKTKKDDSKYRIKTASGEEYVAFVHLPRECRDPDFVPTIEQKGLWACGHMTRRSEMYPAVFSWSVDSRFDSREGAWQNNLDTDYEYLYEFMRGDLPEINANRSKYERLRERRFLSKTNKVNIMVVNDDYKHFFGLLPELDENTKEMFSGFALECAMIEARDYPPQMQELIVNWGVSGFVGHEVALMVLDILYSDGTFKPLTPEERITANLIMFSDVLPSK